MGEVHMAKNQTILTSDYMLTIDNGVGVVETRCQGPRHTCHIAPLSWVGASMFAIDGRAAYLITWLEIGGQMTNGARNSTQNQRISLTIAGGANVESLEGWVKSRLDCTGYVAKSAAIGIYDCMKLLEGENGTNIGNGQQRIL